MWSSLVRERTSTSSWYARHVCHRELDEMLSSALWKEAGAFTLPRASRRNRNKPVGESKQTVNQSHPRVRQREQVHRKKRTGTARLIRKSLTLSPADPPNVVDPALKANRV